GEKPRVLIRGGSDGRYVPTGHIVYAVGSTIWAVRFDAGKLQVLGDPVQIVEGVLRASREAGGGGDAQFGFSNNGSMVYIAGMEVNPRDRVLALVDRNGVRKPLNIPPGLYSQPRLSPHGTRLAVDRDDGKNRDIWIYDFNDAGPIKKLTFEGHNQ